MKAIVSVFVGVLILITSLNPQLSAHFCREQLVDFSIFGMAKSCGDIEESMTLKKPCCKDVLLAVSLEDYFQSKKDSQIPQILIAKERLETFTLPARYATTTEIFNDFPPPPMERIYSHFQSFLL